MRPEKGNWVSVDIELPPEDGTYEVTNFPDAEGDWLQRSFTSTAYYDGFGFMWGGIYRSPQYWRKWIPSERRYGKLNEKET